MHLTHQKIANMRTVPIDQSTVIGTIQRRFADRLIWIFCAYLSLICAAELLLALVDPGIGLAVHALLLLALTLHAGLGRGADGRKLALALTLAPLLRILSLALPLANVPRLAWYPVVSAPLLISALLVIRQLRMSRAELGLRPGNMLIQLMLMGGGLGVGAAEYVLLGSPQLIVAFSWNALTLLAVVLLVFTGFVEELIFRGLLQAAALSALGRWSLIYVSLLFAALQIGYLSVPVVAFALVIGLLFACAARWSGSIVGVVLAHGLANVTLFILMPFLARQASSPVAIFIRSAIATGTTLASVALAILLGRAVWLRRAARLAHSPEPVVKQLPAPAGLARASNARSPSVPAARARQDRKLFFNALLTRPAHRANQTPNLAPAAPMIRTLRRAARMTYVELGQRAQLPARLLAEIEYGLRLPDHDQLGQIFQALGVDMDQLAAAG
jgi:membrane protease YdiL (CAAX protease family)